jgi:SpoVK/Ycf46/Vps4 family AAA+-type ATPase
MIDMATRKQPAPAAWSDLLLRPRELKLLRQLAEDVRARIPAWEESCRGRARAPRHGLFVVFAGAKGTGKTLAAEVLAGELRRPLQRIDLSAVVSKHLGETEKQLERIFAKAEAGDAILLFDEADALFGKRSDPQDSHDRYANLEPGYLLQRIESQCGLVILETNQKRALDPACLRRASHVIDFALPAAAQRRVLWERAIPPAAALDELELRRLAQLELSGARIEAIVVDATARAAGNGVPVDMRLLIDALIRERRKTGMPD